MTRNRSRIIDLVAGRRLKFILLLAALVCAIAVAFHQSILTSFGRFLTLRETPEAADLILVLAGDFYGSRVLTGAELGARGYARHVLISGTPYQNTYDCDLAVRFAVSKGYSPDLFLTARHQATSTIEEARVLEPVLRRLGARRVILVTSDYHSRRASLVFHLFLPGFQFLSVAAPGEFHSSSWWESAPDRRLFFSEYWKMIGTLGKWLFGGLTQAG